MDDIQQILAPTDFSDVSRQGLEFAKSLAKKFSAQLFVVHVIDEPLLNAPTTSDEYRESFAQTQREKLQKLFTPEELETMKPELAVLFGAATKQLLQYIQSHGVDLVVMGMQGRSALADMLLGSVCESLLRKSPCPVVTVRKPATGH